MNKIKITNKESQRAGYKRFYIGRVSPLQNDNMIDSYMGEGCGRIAAIREYRTDLRKKLEANDCNPAIIEIALIKKALSEGNVQLDCHCAPMMCHGEVIKEYLETGKI